MSVALATAEVPFSCVFALPVRSGGRNRTGDTAIMSRLLCRLSYTAVEPPYGIEP